MFMNIRTGLTININLALKVFIERGQILRSKAQICEMEVIREKPGTTRLDVLIQGYAIFLEIQMPFDKQLRA